MQDQIGKLLASELEEKVGWEALVVSSNLLIQAFGCDPIQCCKLGIEQHPASAKDEDGTGYSLYRKGACTRHASSIGIADTSVELRNLCNNPKMSVTGRYGVSSRDCMGGAYSGVSEAVARFRP